MFQYRETYCEAITKVRNTSSGHSSGYSWRKRWIYELDFFWTIFRDKP